VLRDQRASVEDADRLGVGRDLDVLAHEAMGHAVADGVEIDQRIGGDPSPEALLAPREGARGQRPQGRLLVAEEADQRRLVRRPVLAGVGLVHPRPQVRLEVGEGVERAVGEAIVLDVFDGRPRGLRARQRRLKQRLAQLGPGTRREDPILLRQSGPPPQHWGTVNFALAKERPLA
jgi:hypothetical protein